ncbi:MAG: hypothetical protein KIS62_08305 [Ramlibacter sp.]|nr:hypothetical protein [Ramlibacter sp.]
MNSLLDVPVTTVTSLSAERAVVLSRAILRAECGYSRLSPAALTISSRLTVADGGIDAEVNVPAGNEVPTDCIFQPGLTGFQLKSGASFKPWTQSSIRSELLDRSGSLHAEVQRLVNRRGRYVLLCTGHDLTPEQRNDSKQWIATTLAGAGATEYIDFVEVLGASQLAEFAERYPGTTSLLSIDPIQEAWVLDEWQRDAHMASTFEASIEQTDVIERIRSGLRGETKHIRVLGEPGLGKTRVVLEAVKAPDIQQYVLYVQHGSKFAQTQLFRQLIRVGWNRPLVLVLDELPESQLSEVWRHLKPRCGSLKIVSLDHGQDETHDADIFRLDAPRLPDETIKKILVSRIGSSREIDRWVEICEGSPRVAMAVADNLVSNPNDLLRPPATVPIWVRFLHGYGLRDDVVTRQVDCVTQHLALFSRFGYEEPVSSEGQYISSLVQKIDPTIGWARFQEIVQTLRSRRVLQGSRTLFFVPKALHIYLWKQFWERYGRGFNFAQTFKEMPASLHAWFLKMFKFAGSAATSHVVDDILKSDGIFSDRVLLTSATGTRFLSVLAEANGGAVLRLLESTIGKWHDGELLNFKENRQDIVWALGKISVWPNYTVRAIGVLARLATNENADFSNNSTGTLIGLFRIGPEFAATEASPEARLPALLVLLRSEVEAERSLGLKAINAALDTSGIGFRIVGPEYQGLKGRARLWVPVTYDDWWHARLLYFKTLVDETKHWPASQRAEVCAALLDGVKHQIETPPCTALAFRVLDELSNDSAMSSGQLNHFFQYWSEYKNDEKRSAIAMKLRSVARRYAQRNLASRFQRYVIDVDWMVWDENFRERHEKPKNRAKALVNALARRIAQHPEQLRDIEHLLTPSGAAPALWHFGEQLARSDVDRRLLPELTRLTQESKHSLCLHGYLSWTREIEPTLYKFWMNRTLISSETAWLGASITLRSEYVEGLFMLCLDALEKGWIDPQSFEPLKYGKAITRVPPEITRRLLLLLNKIDTVESLRLIVMLLDELSLDDGLKCDSPFVFDVLVRAVPRDNFHEQMHGYYWKKVCLKLITWDSSQAISLLDAMLAAMGETYELSYDSYVAPLMNELAQTAPQAAWSAIKNQFERELPKWRADLLHWLKGGLGSFDEEEPRGAIALLPVADILEWIEQDIESRAALIAHAAIGTLDDDSGGHLTRELLGRYGKVDGVRDGVSATFHTGSWTGSTTAYLKRKRERLRRWLASGFESEVTQWIESEIEGLDRNIEREEMEEERSRFD